MEFIQPRFPYLYLSLSFSSFFTIFHFHFLRQCEYVIHIILWFSSWSHKQQQRCDIASIRMHLFRWIFISIKFYVFNFSLRLFFIFFAFTPVPFLSSFTSCVCGSAWSSVDSMLVVCCTLPFFEMCRSDSACQGPNMFEFHDILLEIRMKWKENAFGYLCVCWEYVSTSANDAQK